MNKEKRLAVYKKALVIYKAYEYFKYGLCYTIEAAQAELFGKVINNAYAFGMKNFPEIWKHRPKRLKTSYWFPPHTRYGIAKRIWILRQAIKELS